ncbi:MAG: RluA family pseudouridine synthase [Bacillota bacterium]|nr:RluA family pseudouridine synthase [Bacillota bacterium]
MQSGENHVSFEVKTKHDGMLLRDFLRKTQKISHKGLCNLKNNGLILCNDEEVTVRRVLKSGDHVTIVYPQEAISDYLTPEPIPLKIIFEDQDLIVVDKPPYICVHPTKGYPQGTMANGLMHYYQQKSEKAGFHAVNRLDRGTSGLILVCKNSFGKQQLYLQQQKKAFTRTYLALVHGELPLDEDTIRTPIRKIDGKTTKRETHLEGQEAVTNYRVLERINNYTLVKLQLETGRTHQIRIHMASIGHPLVGDDLYGGASYYLKRQALHADWMKFSHPRSKVELTFEAELPQDFVKAYKAIKAVF